MNAVHIRFNAASPDFADIMEDGKPQRWTHKQNDALGLVMDGALIAYADGAVTLDELTAPGAAGAGAARLAVIARLVAYLNAVNYYTMEDSGAWEELPRRNTSSIGIVVSALEKLRALLADGADAAFAKAYGETAAALALGEKAGAAALDALIARGYETIRRQLNLGGESPDYDKADPHYREADAALLALIYPACPNELGADEKRKILGVVGTLAGDYGIKRYERDNYQAGNFWWHDIKTDADPESHRKREESFIPGTEAEWFFDSWYAKCCLIVAKDIEAAGAGSAADADALRQKAVKHLNRAFGQITGEGMYSADGKPVPPKVPPESVGHIVASDENATAGAGKPEFWPAPSPIAPLNWAKAALTLALSEFLNEPS
jgi:hypothetical protein